MSPANCPVVWDFPLTSILFILAFDLIDIDKGSGARMNKYGDNGQ